MRAAPSSGRVPRVSYMKSPVPRKRSSPPKATAVDLFCGAGGLTRGLLDGGISVAAGYDIDPACRYPYEHNNRPATFEEKSVTSLKGTDLAKHFPQGHIRILVGCAPCQTFSKYTQGLKNAADSKWTLLAEFARLIRELKPHIVSMENVPQLQDYLIFEKFLQTLRNEGFHFTDDPKKRIVYCPDYGMAQNRHRLVLVASRLGDIALIAPTHQESEYRNVHSLLADLPPLRAGGVCADDPLHRASRLSELNLKRIMASTPGGTWRDWPPEFIASATRKNQERRILVSMAGWSGIILRRRSQHNFSVLAMDDLATLSRTERYRCAKAQFFSLSLGNTASSSQTASTHSRQSAEWSAMQCQ